MRDLEQKATENHLRRLREGRTESIETSSLHIDIVRDLKRIAAHIASVAYPILEQAAPCVAADCWMRTRAPVKRQAASKELASHIKLGVVTRCSLRAPNPEHSLPLRPG
jgi:hypothetical protein